MDKSALIIGLERRRGDQPFGRATHCLPSLLGCLWPALGARIIVRPHQQPHAATVVFASANRDLGRASKRHCWACSRRLAGTRYSSPGQRR